MGLMQKGKCVTGSFLAFFFSFQENAGGQLLVTSPVSFSVPVHQAEKLE